jgi:Tol biopolymer transport system component
MHYTKIILSPWTLILALLVAAASVPVYHHWYSYRIYNYFTYQDKPYYVQIAKDCHAVLKAHPMSSAKLEYSSRGEAYSKLSGADQTLPESLRSLHPDYVSFSTNCVGLHFGGDGRLEWEFGIRKIDENWFWVGERPTNNWVLIAVVPYKSERPICVLTNP